MVVPVQGAEVQRWQYPAGPHPQWA